MSVGPAAPKLALYHYESCFYCHRVRAAIARSGLDIELRNIRTDPERRAELVAARGRKTVPVLRIETGDGRVHWLPESTDIIRFVTRLARGDGSPLQASRDIGGLLVGLGLGAAALLAIVRLAL